MSVDAHAITIEMSEGTGGRGLWGYIAYKLGIPYLRERESRVQGEGATSGPDSFNSLDEAGKKLGRPQAMWFHIPSLNLVIMDERAKVGIRVNQLTMIGLPRRERIIALIEMLDNKMQLDS